MTCPPSAGPPLARPLRAAWSQPVSPRVRGIDGLRVIDASIMLDIACVNTNAPTQTLVRHASAMLVEDLKQNRSDEVLVT